jgi:phosphatidylserine/phosphatidylglycerophosphate/cardiolipin synthase-like enzyme
MTDGADLQAELIREVVALAREVPPGILQALEAALRHGAQGGSLTQVAITASLRDRLRRLEDLRSCCAEVDDRSIAFALRVGFETAAAMAADHRSEIAWTGPAADAIALRRVDQVLYSIIEAATSEILVVTYAAYKAQRAIEALRKATTRNVRVRFVIELAQESGGKLDFDGLQAFRAGVPAAQIFYWPLERRLKSASGSHGAMHAKCVVADRSSALVSSANLTDHALEMNMELGLVAGRSTSRRLADHFDQLILRGELALAP